MRLHFLTVNWKWLRVSLKCLNLVWKRLRVWMKLVVAWNSSHFYMFLSLTIVLKCCKWTTDNHSFHRGLHHFCLQSFFLSQSLFTSSQLFVLLHSNKHPHICSFSLLFVRNFYRCRSSARCCTFGSVSGMSGNEEWNSYITASSCSFRYYFKFLFYC